MCLEQSWTKMGNTAECKTLRNTSKRKKAASPPTPGCSFFQIERNGHIYTEVGSVGITLYSNIYTEVGLQEPFCSKFNLGELFNTKTLLEHKTLYIQR